METLNILTITYQLTLPIGVILHIVYSIYAFDTMYVYKRMSVNILQVAVELFQGKTGLYDPQNNVISIRCCKQAVLIPSPSGKLYRSNVLTAHLILQNVLILLTSFQSLVLTLGLV